MLLIRIKYGSPYWTDPDYYGTVTEQTEIHRAFILKGAIFVITYSFYLIYIHLLSVISLAYCAKVLSNWLSEWIFVPYAFRRY